MVAVEALDAWSTACVVVRRSGLDWTCGAWEPCDSDICDFEIEGLSLTRTWVRRSRG